MSQRPVCDYADDELVAELSELRAQQWRAKEAVRDAHSELKGVNLDLDVIINEIVTRQKQGKFTASA